MSAKEARLGGSVAGVTLDDGYGPNSDGEAETKFEAEKKSECEEEDKEDTEGVLFMYA